MKQNEIDRQRIQRDIQQYLMAGGRIEVVPFGVMNDLEGLKYRQPQSITAKGAITIAQMNAERVA